MHAVDYEQLRIQHVHGNETLDVRYNTPLMTIMSLLLIQRLMNANIDHRVSRNTSSNFRKKVVFLEVTGDRGVFALKHKTHSTLLSNSVILHSVF